MNSLTDAKNFRLDIYKNGAEYVFGRNNSSKTGSSISVNISFIDDASASDYYEVFVYHDEGSNLNAASGRRTSFGASKIIKEGAIIPSEAEVNAKIQEIKDSETQKANDKISAQNKLKALGLTDAEIEAL